MDGAQTILALLTPTLKKQDAALDTRLHSNLNKVDGVLAKYRSKDGFVSYEKLTEADRAKLKGPIAALAEDFSTLKGVFGIS